MNSAEFQVHGISGSFADHVRTTRTDREGNHVRVFRSHCGGEPVRDGLRAVEAGEELILCAYSPFETRSLYREVGPIFLLANPEHAELPTGEFPRDFLPGEEGDLTFRAYNAEEEIVQAELLRGRAPAEVITRFFTNPEVAFIHARFSAYGCFACHIRRV